MVAEKMNYTDRIDLEPSEFSAEYQIRDEQYFLTLKWMLSSRSIKDDCRLFVEMKGGGTTETRRFDLGTVGSGLGDTTLVLTNIRNPELIRIRFGVVEINADGLPLIRADRDRVSPVNLDENNRARSLLKLVKSPDLAVPWRVEIFEDEPILLVSDRHELFHNLRDTSPLFTPLVLSEVVRQIFEWVALSGVDGEVQSVKRWITYFGTLSCPPEFFEADRSRSDEDDVNEVAGMANVVSEEFAKKFRMIEKIAATFEDGRN